MVQRPEECLVLYPNTIHFGFNTGPNIAEVVNFAAESLIPGYLAYLKCGCKLEWQIMYALYCVFLLANTDVHFLAYSYEVVCVHFKMCSFFPKLMITEGCIATSGRFSSCLGLTYFMVSDSGVRSTLSATLYMYKQTFRSGNRRGRGGGVKIMWYFSESLLF